MYSIQGRKSNPLEEELASFRQQWHEELLAEKNKKEPSSKNGRNQSSVADETESLEQQASSPIHELKPPLRFIILSKDNQNVKKKKKTCNIYIYIQHTCQISVLLDQCFLSCSASCCSQGRVLF